MIRSKDWAEVIGERLLDIRTLKVIEGQLYCSVLVFSGEKLILMGATRANGVSAYDDASGEERLQLSSLAAPIREVHIPDMYEMSVALSCLGEEGEIQPSEQEDSLQVYDNIYVYLEGGPTVTLFNENDSSFFLVSGESPTSQMLLEQTLREGSSFFQQGA